MSRLTATINYDVKLQIRNGFYYAALFVAILAVALLRLIPSHFLAFIMPPMIVGNLIINTFYFSGGQMLLEKREQTLSAQVVTPLLTSEYLASKVLSLALLSLLENVVIVLLVYGPSVNIALLLPGILIACGIFTYAGLAVVVRYDSINEYLLPSIVYVGALCLPLIAWLAQWDHILLYLHPLQAAMIVTKGAFSPITGLQLAYGLVYGAAWIVYLRSRAERSFCRHIIGGESYS